MIRWLGDELIAKLTDATREAIDETTAAAAEDANGTSLDLPAHTAAGHRWHGVTSREVGTVASEPAKAEGSQVKGRFGDTAGRGTYGLFLERIDPYMRPAADREFPKLAERIRENLD